MFIHKFLEKHYQFDEGTRGEMNENLAHKIVCSEKGAKTQFTRRFASCGRKPEEDDPCVAFRPNDIMPSPDIEDHWLYEDLENFVRGELNL